MGQDRICTSIGVAAEIRYGVAKRASPRLAEWADRVRLTLDILAFDHPAERAYASIHLDLERRGMPIDANDLTLATNNRPEFGPIAGLRIEDWRA